MNINKRYLNNILGVRESEIEGITEIKEADNEEDD